MRKWFVRVLVALLLLLSLAVLTVWWLLRGSLPTLDGELSLPGLLAPVAIQRDKIGVVSIEAANERDAMRALGYVHAQERYFEMDLMRRTAAGELAELFGPIAVDTDKEHRVHRFRARVMQNLDAIAGDKLPVLQAYVDGVNAGLSDLKVRPWPYLLLRTEPEPWQLADTPLVGYAMYFDLQDSTNARELALWRIKQHVPGALFALLTHAGSSWDAALEGEPRGDAILPDEATMDLRKLPMPARPRAIDMPINPETGSNNFAVSGAMTNDGRAIVANDMHLGLRAPNIWFRAQLRYPDARAPDSRVDVGGFTLPGLPGVLVGSNGHVAWGFTNSYIDSADWYKTRVCSAASLPPDELCTVSSSDELFNESIEVKGKDPVTLIIREKHGWGPILHTSPDGDRFALRWVAHLPGSLNLGLSDLSRAKNLEQLALFADSTSLPTQNLVAADSSGDALWRLIGPVPSRKFPCTKDTPNVPRVLSGNYGDLSLCIPWPIDNRSSPTVANPTSSRLWTANNRIVEGAALQQLGDSGYVLGARAKQIRDALFAREKFSERDLLAIQLNDRALFLQRWWQLLRVDAARGGSPALRELAAAATTWQGLAGTDSVSYRIVRGWRLAVHDRIAAGLTAPAQAHLGKQFEMPDLPQFEGVVWPLVTQRPAHLLPRRFATWDALFEDAAREVRGKLEENGPLAQRSWGERNTARICHPLANAIPLIGKRALCMPPDQLPGDSHMPRVQGPDFGASQRMVVSPGHEADGIIHMPGGQSGHPLSPFWGAGHDDWVHGRPTPFLPGATQHTLRMSPPRWKRSSVVDNVRVESGDPASRR